MKTFLKTILITIASILGVFGLVAVGVTVAAPALIGSILSGDVFEPKSESHASEVTRAIERRSEVALGQQGIKTAKDVQTIWGIEIPGSDRAVLLQYSFTAKLGIDGSLVTVKEAGPKNFTISIPAFQLIGFDHFTSSVAVEQNGVLSWVTPEIDQTEMIEQVLSSDKKQELVRAHSELLKSQAQSFYGGIVEAVDSEIQLKFDFKDTK